MNLQDSVVDPQERAEWLESVDGLISGAGPARAGQILRAVRTHAVTREITSEQSINSDYVNTIPADAEPEYPGDEHIEKRYRAWVRWNAAIMVHRAQSGGRGVGGHISTYAGAATLYEVGLNHFWRGRDHPGGGDQIFFQGHASPGMYARAYLEGRLSRAHLDGFRQEKSAAPHGLSSYPHPRLMPEFWEFPTVSMGLGPMNAIYQAQSNRYLAHRGLADTAESRVWAFLGDGEMDEPESRGLLQLAANDRLDNLVFVVNCNMQRLDGPVRGNGKIIQELEAFFRGAGWNVIKVIWGRGWDELLARDHDGELRRIMNETPDGDYQTYKAESGAFIREHFFGKSPSTLRLVEHLSDDEIWALGRGGHDYRKVHAAYAAAAAHVGQPSVILVKTVKGDGLGTRFEGRNATHQMKSLTVADLKGFRDRMRIPISDELLDADPELPPYYHPGADSPELAYLRERRASLGGFIPERRAGSGSIRLPGAEAFASATRGSGKQRVATTQSFVRILKDLLREPEFGQRIVPIIPDEARTFGMDAFFSTQKIYNPAGQNYLSVDRDIVLSYRESPQGQILHAGINEAGSMAAFTAAGTAYSTHSTPLIPVYVFYSMFGFQRTADSIWAAADQLARGFLISATAGRTTLTGEGLQHADGHSPLLAATNPAVKTYDPAFGYEIAVIMKRGLHEMYGEPGGGKNVIYNLMVYNEPTAQPASPEHLDEDGIMRGMHRIVRATGDGVRVRLLASGIAMSWAQQAGEMLRDEWAVEADIWSVTSWGELRRDGLAVERARSFGPGAVAVAGVEKTPVGERAFITTALADSRGPVIAVSDYSTDLPDMVRPFIPGDYAVLGADGFGFSDTRASARRFFRIDAESIVVRALRALSDRGDIDASIPAAAAVRYGLSESD